MTPEKIERKERLLDHADWLDRDYPTGLDAEGPNPHATLIRALIAEWEEYKNRAEAAEHNFRVEHELAEERGREIERLKAEVAHWKTEFAKLDLGWRFEHRCVERAKAQLAQVVEAAGEPCPILGTASPEFVWERAMSFVLAAAQPKEER